MPKIKTLKAAAKRFKKTASGKFKRGHSHATHQKLCKNGKRRRNLRGTTMVSQADTPRLRRMMPY
jgi:large subunit ribosomal protein L35